MRRRPPRTTHFPYTTLFRSGPEAARILLAARERGHGLQLVGGHGLGMDGLWAIAGRLGDGTIFIGRVRKSTRLNSSHANISYALFCLQKTYSNSYRICIERR